MAPQHPFRINTVFGIELPVNLQDLTEFIGEQSAQAVRFYKTTNPQAYEECGFEGKEPTVGLRDPDGLDLYNIAHGLCHLRCRIRGYPASMTMHAAKDGQLVSDTCSDLQSLIEHQIIYPELEALGYQPKRETETIVINTFQTEKLTKKVRERRAVRMALPIVYARVQLEVPAGETANEVEQWFLQTERQTRNLGRKIVSKIRNADLSDWRGYVQAFDDCMQLLGIPAPDYGWTWEPFPEAKEQAVAVAASAGSLTS